MKKKILFAALALIAALSLASCDLGAVPASDDQAAMVNAYIQVCYDIIDDPAITRVQLKNKSYMTELKEEGYKNEAEGIDIRSMRHTEAERYVTIEIAGTVGAYGDNVIKVKDTLKDGAIVKRIATINGEKVILEVGVSK